MSTSKRRRGGSTRDAVQSGRALPAKMAQRFAAFFGGEIDRLKDVEFGKAINMVRARRSGGKSTAAQRRIERAEQAERVRLIRSGTGKSEKDAIRRDFQDRAKDGTDDHWLILTSEEKADEVENAARALRRWRHSKKKSGQ